MEQPTLEGLVQQTIEGNEQALYDALRAAVFGVAAETSCSIPTVLGWLACVTEELRSTVMEDVSDDAADADNAGADTTDLA